MMLVEHCQTCHSLNLNQGYMAVIGILCQLKKDVLNNYVIKKDIEHYIIMKKRKLYTKVTFYCINTHRHNTDVTLVMVHT